MTGYHYKNIAHAGQAFAEVRTSDEVRWKRDTREITNVFTVRYHSLQQVDLKDAAEADVAARSGKLQRQRRSPGTGADDCDRFGGFATY